MGLPRGWTTQVPLHPDVLAQHPLSQWPRWPASRLHRTVSLFSGIGALDFALSRWCRTIAYVEIDPGARDILFARMSDGSLDKARAYEDISCMHDIGPCDGLVGGFPCIDNSVAGSRSGLEGLHTCLVLHVFRLADETRCGFIFLENVDGLRSLRSVWARLFAELLQRGFELRWVTLAVSQVGLPQRRRRWFLYARRGAHRDAPLADTLGSSLPVLPPSPTSARPPVSEWLRRGRTPFDRARLRVLGNAVVPLQGFWAARWLTQ